MRNESELRIRVWLEDDEEMIVTLTDKEDTRKETGFMMEDK